MAAISPRNRSTWVEAAPAAAPCSARFARNVKVGAIDLSGVKVDAPHRKSLREIVADFEDAAAKVRARDRSQALERSRGGLLRIPALLIGFVMRLLSFLNYGLNLDLRWAGIPRDPFGGAMVTNIGSLGLEAAYVPLVPFSRVPLLVAVGAIEDIRVVRDGELTVADPDGIVVDACYVAIGECNERLAGAPPWVRDPLGLWLNERWDTGRAFRFQVEGTDHRSLRVSALP